MKYRKINFNVIFHEISYLLYTLITNIRYLQIYIKQLNETNIIILGIHVTMIIWYSLIFCPTGATQETKLLLSLQIKSIVIIFCVPTYTLK